MRIITIKQKYVLKMKFKWDSAGNNYDNNIYWGSDLKWNKTPFP